MVAAVIRRVLGWRCWVLYELWRLQAATFAARLHWKLTLALVPLDADAFFFHRDQRHKREDAALHRFLGVLADLREVRMTKTKRKPAPKPKPKPTPPTPRRRPFTETIVTKG